MSDFVLSTKVGLDTSSVQTQLNAMSKKYSITTSVKLENGSTGTQELTKYQDAVGNTATTVTKLNAESEQLSSKLTNVRDKSESARTGIAGLGQDFAETTGKVLKFGASTAVIGLFTTAIYGAVSAILEYDTAVTNFKKVSDLSGDSLNDYTKRLGDLGAQVARTRKQNKCEYI